MNDQPMAEILLNDLPAGGAAAYFCRDAAVR